MNVREQYPIGARVKLTDLAVKSFMTPRNGSQFGRVVGYSRNPNCIRVLVDGIKTRTTYHHHFWEVCES